MFNISEFYCTECGHKTIPIVRIPGGEHKGGHLKKLYCLNCKTQRNCAEVRECGKYTYETFIQEFTKGRFVDGERKRTCELPHCKSKTCDSCVNGRCWDTAHHQHCEHHV